MQRRDVENDTSTVAVCFTVLAVALGFGSLAPAGCGGSGSDPKPACRRLAKCQPCGMSYQERLEEAKETMTDDACDEMVETWRTTCTNWEESGTTCAGERPNCSQCGASEGPGS